MAVITAERLRELLHYDPDTGEFTWLVRRGIRSAGKIAGTLHPSGYRYIKVDERSYREHQLAWIYARGVPPGGEIDHINGIKDDNRLCNLRDVTKSVNKQNMRKPRADNRSGLLGVSWDRRRDKWQARINVCGAKRSLGYFTDPTKAHAAYIEAKRASHAGCTI